jgi:hypothetical protein
MELYLHSSTRLRGMVLDKYRDNFTLQMMSYKQNHYLQVSFLRLNI